MAIWRGICVLTVLTLLATGSHSQLSECGQPPLNTRIVGGQDAPEGSWPWQASLHRDGSHSCGGSLINNKWVLSAAHCFTGSNSIVRRWRVYVGRQRQGGLNPNEQNRTVTRIISHPLYNDDTSDNDIALLELSSTVSFTNYIRPACLAASGSSFHSGTDTWVTGFGITSEDATELPDVLQEVNVDVVGNRQCNCLYGVGSITNNMICAGVLAGGRDSCQGDSGGPMVNKQSTRWIQSGVVSFGVGCARPNFPGVYARVSRYQSWITSVLQTNLPGFIRFTSSGTDSDNSITCPGLPPPPTTLPPTTTPAPVVCGRAPLNGRIGGGSGLAGSGVWPWQASLHRGGAHVCGGTLISEDIVMSAAQCFSSPTPNPAEWTVFLGRLRQNGSNPFQTSVNVTSITLSNLTGTNIALLKLGAKPSLTRYIQPVCVDLVATAFTADSQCWVTGWGAGQGGEEQVLQELQVNVVTCDGNSSSSEVICTAALQLQQGDQGGPLVCKQGDAWLQAAVITVNDSSNSTQNSRSRASTQQMFSRTSRFSNFLRENVGSFPPAFNLNPGPTTTSKAPPCFSFSCLLPLFLLSLCLLPSWSS